MKHRLKITALILVFVLLLGGLSSGAAPSNVIFTAVNNTLLPLSDSTMPAWFYDTPYIPYSVFTDYFQVSSSYDQSKNRLTLFNADYVITFDLNLNFSYDAGRTAFLDSAVRHNSTVYVPAIFTARQLGLYCTYFQTGPVVRVKTPFSMSDSVFITTIGKTMSTYLDQYVKSLAEPPSGAGITPGSTTGSEHTHTRTPIYLVFSGVPSASTDSILDSLQNRNIKATFVLDGENIAQSEEIIRKIAVAGHSIGLGGNASVEPEFYTSSNVMIENLREQNGSLRLILKTETRIVLPSGASDILNPAMSQILAAKGYRLWRTTYHPAVSEKDSARTFYQNTVKLLENIPQPIIMKLNCDGLTADALPEILDWLEYNNYSFHKISQEDTPPPE